MVVVARLAEDTWPRDDGPSLFSKKKQEKEKEEDRRPERRRSVVVVMTMIGNERQTRARVPWRQFVCVVVVVVIDGGGSRIGGGGRRRQDACFQGIANGGHKARMERSWRIKS